MNEERLATLLHDRAERVPDTGLTVSDVRRRAGRVRRRRAATPLLAAATVAAVVVGGGVVRGPGGERPSSPATTTTSPAPTPSAAVLRLRSVASIARGVDPRVEYLRDGTFVDPAGGRYALPAISGEVTAFARFSRSRLVGTESDGSVVLFDDGGRTVNRDYVSGQFALAPGRDGAWIASAGRLVLQPPDTFADVVRAQVGNRVPVGVVADGSVVLTGAGGTSTGVVLVDPTSDRTTTVPGLGTAVAAAPDGSLVAGRSTAESASKGEQVVVDRDGRVLWSSARWEPLSFSPDGELVAAVDRSRSTRIAILRARTGEVVSNGLLDAVGRQAVWEDATHVLLVGHDRTEGRWAVVRLGADGSLERASDVVAGSGQRSPWVLGTQP